MSTSNGALGDPAESGEPASKKIRLGEAEPAGTNGGEAVTGQDVDGEEDEDEDDLEEEAFVAEEDSAPGRADLYLDTVSTCFSTSPIWLGMESW